MNSGTIALIMTFAFVIVLVIGFFVGIWRGLKKSSINLIFSLIGVVVSFFITPLITNIIMGINIDYNGQITTIENFLVTIMKENQDIANMIENNPNLELFIANLPSALAKVIIFVILTFIIEMIIYFIYKLIAVIFFKSEKGEKKHRILGGVIGIVKTFIITVVAFMPLAGLIGVANKFTYSENYYISTTYQTNSENNNSNLKNGVLGEYLPDQTIQLIRGLENNILTKICSVFELDNKSFDYLSKFEIDNQTIYIREELENYYEIADFSLQVSKQGNMQFSNLNYDKLEKILNDITDNSLFKTIVCDVVADMIVHYKEYDFIANNQFVKEFSDIIEEIGEKLLSHKNEETGYQNYFSNDINQIFQTFKILGQNGIIDQIINLEESSLENILNILTSEQNQSKFTNAINSLAKVNLIRDGITPIIQNGLDSMLSGIDKISVDLSSWNEQDWTDLSNSLSQIVNKYSNISNQIDVNLLFNDVTVILDKDSNYDIEEILNNLGSLIDEIRNVKLLKNEQGIPVIDKFLTENNISLPQEKVYDSNGELQSIENYQQLFSFIAPSLIQLRDSGLYEIISSSGDSTSVMTNLANLISEEGNNDLLNNILLPLQQVEPIKSIINEKLNSFTNEIIDFSNLTTYQDWKDDYKYISQIIISLNKNSTQDKTFLELALNGNIDELLNSLSKDEIDNVMKPILYAKSTSSFKQKLINNVKDVLDSLTSPALSKIDISSITLKESDANDQTQEICNVFKSFIEINKVYQDGTTLKDIDNSLLSELFISMQQNAYRVELEDNKTEIGLFNGAFENLMTKLKDTYSDAISFIETQEGYENYFAKENYKNIDFVKVFELINQYEQSQA